MVQRIGLLILSTGVQINGERTLVNLNEREASAGRKRTTQIAVPKRALDIAADKRYRTEAFWRWSYGEEIDGKPLVSH